MKMNGASDQFLASAAFAGYQYGAVTFTDIFDQPVNLLHTSAAADNIIQLETVFDVIAKVFEFGNILDSIDYSHYFAIKIEQRGNRQSDGHSPAVFSGDEDFLNICLNLLQLYFFIFSYGAFIRTEIGT